MTQKIKVSKFGGSSMKDALAMNRSAQVVKNPQTQMLSSATYGTTNQLLNLIDLSSQVAGKRFLKRFSK